MSICCNHIYFDFSHEIDEDEVAAEKIKSTFQIMGFSLNSTEMPKGQLIYRKRLGRLRPPRYKRLVAPSKTYFDDAGNAYQLDQVDYKFLDVFSFTVLITF